MNINSSSSYGVSVYSSYGGSSTASTNDLSSKFAEALLSTMDADSSGGVDSTEFSKAALELSGISDESAISEAFSGLDTDENGAISLDELSSAFESMASQGGAAMAAGAPPPPPPGPPPSESEDEEDTGYTVDELTTLASDVSSTDSDLSSLFETLVANFDAADTDGDGRVTASEAMAYQESSKEESMGVSEKKGEEDLMKGLLAQIISSYGSQNTLAQSVLNLSA
ncbi:MAG: hypothetical protein KU29_00885 [Sulfurovum sp. FS06-10]|nr:MAG: hypothetical protein KU29_00885 [Sulfurovum sp. FS06-10]